MYSDVEKSNIVLKENLHAAQSFDRLQDVVLCRGEGIYLWDTDGRRYTDLISASSCLNQGHCHPKILKELTSQAGTLTVTANSFHNPWLAEYAEYITRLFGYEKVLPLNSGCEAGDAACKLARKWGYLRKKIPDNEAKIVFAEGYYMGRTMTGISASTNTRCRQHYGPFMPGFLTVRFDDLEALEEILKIDPNICAYMTEPILGNSGIIVPRKGYLKNVEILCRKYNVLWIVDEIQSGLGRTGKLLTVHHEDARPDIICLGKSLSGGTIPISAVLADDHVMSCMQRGEHGSTFGGNPLSCRVALAALKVIVDEKLPERALMLGELLNRELQMKLRDDAIAEIRGKGLFYAVVLKDGLKFNAKDVTRLLLENGILTTSLTKDVIRIVPPLIISEEELLRCANIIVDVINSLYDNNRQ